VIARRRPLIKFDLRLSDWACISSKRVRDVDFRPFTNFRSTFSALSDLTDDTVVSSSVISTTRSITLIVVLFLSGGPRANTSTIAMSKWSSRYTLGYDYAIQY
jgi:hypothetical protein